MTVLQCSVALNMYEMLKDLSSLKETSCVCQFLSHLSRFWLAWSMLGLQGRKLVVLTMTSCLVMLRHYTPSLDSMILEGVLDLAEYPPLFSLSLTPPTLDCTTPPSLATLTTCLSSGLLLLNKLEPHKLGTPFRSPSRSPRAAVVNKKKTDYFLFLEQSVFLLLSQATRYLVDPSVDVHDKQVLKKELANELDHFSSGLLRNFHRKGIPSPKSTTPPSRGHLHSLITGTSLHDSSASSKASSLCFSDSSEQAMFKLADSFAKQFFR